MSKALTAVLISVITLLLASVGYFIFQNQKVLKQLSQQTSSPTSQVQPASASASTQSQKQGASPSPTMSQEQIKENVVASINSKNFAAIATYTTTPTVNISLMSSECCQPMTPGEAAVQMEYVKEGVPMDFNQQNPTIKNLKAKNQELADAFIGISQTKEHLAAFKFDNQNKISWIQLAITWKLYNN